MGEREGEMTADSVRERERKKGGERGKRHGQLICTYIQHPPGMLGSIIDANV